MESSNVSNNKTNNAQDQPPIEENKLSIKKVVAPFCFLPDSFDKRTVGINGFNKVKKLIYIMCIKRGIPVVHINDPDITIDDIVYSMTYDTAYGKMLDVSRCKLDGNYIIGKYNSCNCPINKDSINTSCSKKSCPCPFENKNSLMEQQVMKSGEACSRKRKITCPNKCAEEKPSELKNCPFLKNIMCPCANLDDPRCIKEYTETHTIFRTLITNERDPSKINWKCDILIEASGILKSHDSIYKHAVDMVIATASSIDLPMFVYGVNHMNYLKEKPKYFSNASCTTNCLAPIIKLLDDRFGIVKGSMSIIHSTSAFKSIVNKFPRVRKNRSILNNIIPTTDDATVEVTKIFPHLENRITGIGFRVPTLDVSCIDITVFLKDECTKENLIELIEQGDRDILDYTLDQVVSSDFIGDSRSCILDVNASILNGRWIKLVCWYDNEYGYAQRVVDLMTFVLQNNRKGGNSREEVNSNPN